MSGITGIVYKNTLNNMHDMQRMSNAIVHRGPDDEGYFAVNTDTGNTTELGGEKTKKDISNYSSFCSNANIYLAHRRLSTLDSSNYTHQPMPNKQKNIWVTYDGEIYNYKSLRHELAEFDLKSKTDTEVLLYAYEKWGINCLHRFNGIWAFVIYDAKKNIIFGSRDRFGIKPLYYTQTQDFFAFSSEIKGLLTKSGISRKLNINASNTYLRLGQDYFGGETFFNDIFELKPAHYFVYDFEKKNIYFEKYYELPFCNIWEHFNEKKCNDYFEGVKDRIVQSIDLRLNADISTGSCLSGGIDSSAIVCSINKLTTSKQKVITACYNNSRIDESKWAQYVIDHVSADWYKIFPKKEELIDDLSDLIHTQDIPFGSTSIYAQYRVFKAANEAGIKIMFDGQGGDELFTGYTPYYYTFYSEAKKNNDIDLLKMEQKYIQNTPFSDVNIERIIIKNNIKTYAKKYLPNWTKNILRSFFWQPESKYLSITGKSYNQYSFNTLNQMLYALMSYTSLPQLLRYGDRNAMRFSIASRTPFADDIDLIEYIFSIPGVYKIHNGWSKYILRESMRNIIPKQIKERTDKIGFATPEFEWLQPIKPIVFDAVNTDIHNIIRIKQMEKDWEKIFANQNRNGNTNIWRYINFILWFNIFKVCL